MMRVDLSTPLPCSVDLAWRQVALPSHLAYLTWPLLVFRPARGHQPPAAWQVGVEVKLWLWLLGFIPLGWHRIRIVAVDPVRKTVETSEHGLSVPTWRHQIAMETTAPSACRYRDVIEIDAGWRTLAVWAFAQGLFRYRHWRWRRWVRSQRPAP